MNRPTVVLTPSEHRDQKVILISFEKNKDLVDRVRKISEAQWSQTKTSWYIPRKDFDLNEIFQIFKEVAFIDYSALKVNKQPLLAKKNQTTIVEIKNEIATLQPQIQEFKLWLEHKRYSENTIKNYIELVRKYLLYSKSKPLNEINNDDIVNFVNNYIIPNGLSFSYQNQMVSALKLFFSQVIDSRIEIEKLERPRREHKLPNVLSKDEVKHILQAPRNIKHRTMLCLIYACGLRRSELLHLTPTDVDSRRHLLIIRNAKGRKDRVVPISDKTIEMLRKYYSLYKPKIWLFEGANPSEQYSANSLQNVFKQSLERAGIRKNATLHWLRHSYATHLLEGGTDLRYIQELLGHKSSKTTEIYTHVTEKSIERIKSPFDDMQI